MEAEKDYGIARYGAKLSRAKLHMRKELEVQLAFSRLIDAREAAEIAAILGQNAPGCSVLLSAQFEDGLPARRAFLTCSGQAGNTFRRL